MCYRGVYVILALTSTDPFKILHYYLLYLNGLYKNRFLTTTHVYIIIYNARILQVIGFIFIISLFNFTDNKLEIFYFVVGFFVNTKLFSTIPDTVLLTFVYRFSTRFTADHLKKDQLFNVFAYNI